MKRAFAHLNLTRNPFGEPTPQQRGRLAVVDVGPYVDALSESGSYIEFRGKRGRGKSTRLHAIADRLTAAAFVRVPQELDLARKVELPRADVVLVDDAQFLSSRQRREVFERGGSVAAATHDSLAEHARTAGFDVIDVQVGGLERDHLGAIVARRIAWARRSDGPVPMMTDAALDTLIASFGDDLRTIEDVLYSVFQALDAVAEIGPAQIEGIDMPKYTIE